MNTKITIEGRDIAVSLSKAALQALDQRRSPILVELELFFSCLIRKRVNFSEQAGNDAGVSVLENLNLIFRPVMTRACGVDYGGNWSGEFGY